MKYKVIKLNNGSIARIDFPEENMKFINLYLTCITSYEKYIDAVNNINEVISGKRGKKSLFGVTCEVLIEKETTEIEYTPDIGPDDWEPGEYENRFSYIPTAKFKEAVEIWWKEYSSYLNSQKNKG